MKAILEDRSLTITFKFIQTNDISPQHKLIQLERDYSYPSLNDPELLMYSINIKKIKYMVE